MDEETRRKRASHQRELSQFVRGRSASPEASAAEDMRRRMIQMQAVSMPPVLTPEERRTVLAIKSAPSTVYGIDEPMVYGLADKIGAGEVARHVVPLLQQSIARQPAEDSNRVLRLIVENKRREAAKKGRAYQESVGQIPFESNLYSTGIGDKTRMEIERILGRRL